MLQSGEPCCGNSGRGRRGCGATHLEGRARQSFISCLCREILGIRILQMLQWKLERARDSDKKGFLSHVAGVVGNALKLSFEWNGEPPSPRALALTEVFVYAQGFVRFVSKLNLKRNSAWERRCVRGGMRSRELHRRLLRLRP